MSYLALDFKIFIKRDSAQYNVPHNGMLHPCVHIIGMCTHACVYGVYAPVCVCISLHMCIYHYVCSSVHDSKRLHMQLLCLECHRRANLQIHAQTGSQPSTPKINCRNLLTDILKHLPQKLPLHFPFIFLSRCLPHVLY